MTKKQEGFGPNGPKGGEMKTVEGGATVNSTSVSVQTGPAKPPSLQGRDSQDAPSSPSPHLEGLGELSPALMSCSTKSSPSDTPSVPSDQQDDTAAASSKASDTNVITTQGAHRRRSPPSSPSSSTSPSLTSALHQLLHIVHLTRSSDSSANLLKRGISPDDNDEDNGDNPSRHRRRRRLASLLRHFLKLLALSWLGLKLVEALKAGREAWKLSQRRRPERLVMVAAAAAAASAAESSGMVTRRSTMVWRRAVGGVNGGAGASRGNSIAATRSSRSARLALVLGAMAQTFTPNGFGGKRISPKGVASSSPASNAPLPPTALQTSLFFAGFPTLWRLLSTLDLDDARSTRPATSSTLSLAAASAVLALWAPRALSSPIVTQLNLYAVSAALLAGVRWCSVDNDVVSKAASVDTVASAPPQQQQSRHLPYWLMSRDQRRAAGYGTPASSSATNVRGKVEEHVPDELTNRHWAWLDEQQQQSPVSRQLAGGIHVITSAAIRSGKVVAQAVSSGGGWWLFPLTQGWLLYCCVFEPDCFPAGYRRIIVARSHRYLPSSQSLGRRDLPDPNALITLLPTFTRGPMPFARLPSLTTPEWATQHAAVQSIISSASPEHTRTLCATLHPLQPGCGRNWLASVVESLPSAAALVGTWAALVGAIRWRKSRQGLRQAFVQWLETTVRGASFISLAICSAWGYVCLFQRLLRPTTLQRGRFALGGTLAGLWILLVPAARRLELGMYAFRLSLLAAWKVAVKRGWVVPKRHLSALPTALSLALLVHLHRRLSATSAPLTGDNDQDDASALAALARRKRVLHGWVGTMVVGWLERDRDLAAATQMQGDRLDSQEQAERKQ